MCLSQGVGERKQDLFYFQSFVYSIVKTHNLQSFSKRRLRQQTINKWLLEWHTRARGACRAGNALPPQGPVLGGFQTGDGVGWEAVKVCLQLF